MQKSYNSIDGQSLFDVCLQVYGSLDFLYKLIQDSGVNNVNSKPRSQQRFVYDDTLVVNQGISNQFLLSGIIYATDTGDNGEAYYIIKQPSPPPIVKTPNKLPPPPNSEEMFIRTNATSFTSGADGTAVITPLDKDGLSMIGYDMVQLELEIKPLKNADYVWNKTLGTITLLGGIVLDKDQTLFIIYSQTIS